MIVGVARETVPGERRVALVPASVQPLIRVGLEVLVEQGAGDEAGFLTSEYVDKGASAKTRDEVFAKADIILQVIG
ncbi:NAD(P)(+) transhydrogenase (Re/Si-specific) subunit alpha, partial [bacterium]